MYVSKLPPKPDFDAVVAATPASADRRTFVLALIGNLICSWSNKESLFIYVLMILLRTDEASAAVVFATLNTTRARLDLIQRLAKIRVTDKALAKSMTVLIERFSESTKVRNELNHCMFIFDSAGAITHTQSMRLMETRSSLRFGEIKALDESRLQEMLQTTKEMTKINRDIWDLLPRLEAHERCRNKSLMETTREYKQPWLALALRHPAALISARSSRGLRYQTDAQTNCAEQRPWAS